MARPGATNMNVHSVLWGAITGRSAQWLAPQVIGTPPLLAGRLHGETSHLSMVGKNVGFTPSRPDDSVVGIIRGNYRLVVGLGGRPTTESAVSSAGPPGSRHARVVTAANTVCATAVQASTAKYSSVRANGGHANAGTGPRY